MKRRKTTTTNSPSFTLSVLQFMPAIKFVLSILLLIVIASFAVKNMGSVEFTYYDLQLQLHSIELPLMVVLVIPLVLGLLIAWFMDLFDRFKLKSIIRQQNRSISSMEEELENLKNTPQIPIQAESSNDS
jgi:uncharacterized integral membrane protein